MVKSVQSCITSDRSFFVGSHYLFLLCNVAYLLYTLRVTSLGNLYKNVKFECFQFFHSLCFTRLTIFMYLDEIVNTFTIVFSPV